LIDLLNKSRSANVTCIAATQSLSDLDFAAGEAFREQIIENCNNYIVLRQNSAKSSEEWAKVIGTKNTMAMTYQIQEGGGSNSTGYGSARQVREFIFHPDEIKQLKTGSAFFVSKDMGEHSKIRVKKPF
jgi:type IV secretory pathway TraG/TraD family ATPase VirD4